MPVSRSPSSWVISDRSMPSPAVAVPASTLAVRSLNIGSRLTPSKASLVSLAKPIRSSALIEAASVGLAGAVAMGHLGGCGFVELPEQRFDLGDGDGDLVEQAAEISARGGGIG